MILPRPTANLCELNTLAGLLNRDLRSCFLHSPCTVAGRYRRRPLPSQAVMSRKGAAITIRSINSLAAHMHMHGRMPVTSNATLMEARVSLHASARSNRRPVLITWRHVGEAHAAGSLLQHRAGRRRVSPGRRIVYYQPLPGLVGPWLADSAAAEAGGS